MYTEENPMEQKDFVKSIVYNAWNEFCDEDKKQPDLEMIEPILKNYWSNGKVTNSIYVQEICRRICKRY